jgi:uncharacterized surface protein with fasciclin (FAS1) repeats
MPLQRAAEPSAQAHAIRRHEQRPFGDLLGEARKRGEDLESAAGQDWNRQRDDPVAQANRRRTFTVFAPTNAAFQKLPAGTVDTLLKAENKPTLTKVLTYHVVAGRLSSMDLKKWIKKGNGTATLKTVSGGTLWAMMDGNDIKLKDEKGDIARITQANVFQSNGVIHVIDTVVLPQ